MGGTKDPITNYHRNVYIDHSDEEYEKTRKIGRENWKIISKIVEEVLFSDEPESVAREKAWARYYQQEAKNDQAEDEMLTALEETSPEQVDSTKPMNLTYRKNN